MSRRFLCVTAALLFGAGLAVAAEPIKMTIKEFQPVKGGSTELFGYDEGEEKLFLLANGGLEDDVTVPEDGEYTVTVDASCLAALGENAQFKLTVGKTVVTEKTVLTDTAPKPYAFPVKLTKGSHQVKIEFLNDAYKENEYDRNLYVHGVKFEKK